MGRRYPGQRAVRIGLRTAHIGAMALVLGAATFDGDPGWALFTTLATGAALVLDAVYKDGLAFLRYLAGAAALLKLGLLLAGLIWPSVLLPALWTALVIGGLISHAPGRIRHAPLWGPPGPCAR